MITFADTPHLTTDFTTNVEHVENDLLTVHSKARLLCSTRFTWAS